MNFAFKSLAVAAALVAAGAANAATATGTVGQNVQVVDPLGSGRIAELTLKPSGGTLYFSHGYGDSTITPAATQTAGPAGLIGALNVGKVVITGVDGAAVTETNVTYGGRTKVTERGSVAIAANVSSLTGIIDGPNAGQFTTVTATGGARQSAVSNPGVLGGGNAVVNNLVIDISGKRVLADLLSNAGESFEVKEKGFHLWNFDTITGPTSINPKDLLADADLCKTGNCTAPNMTAAGYTLGGYNAVTGLWQASTSNNVKGLRITTAGFDFFTQALDIAPGGTAFNTLKAVNDTTEGWGTLKSQINFSVREVTATPAVPEPSTYAMMLLGLAGVGFVARRRAK